MYDTVVAYTYARNLDLSDFDGGAVYEDMDTGRKTGRYWRNPSEQADYRPRFTYFPLSCILRVEFSLEKIAQAYRCIHPQTVDDALNQVDGYIFDAFGLVLPSIREWNCTRIDYTWTWLVRPDVATYISAVRDVHLPRASRADFDKSGVVWKNKSRWIKLYDKSKEAALGGEWLRFEVSQYKRGVAHLCDKWFGCESTVQNLLHPGRALYVLAHYLEQTGLHRDHVEMHLPEMARLRDVFGRGAPAAYWHLMMIRRLGRNASVSDLSSQQSVSIWTRRLREHGFILGVDDKDAPLTHLKGLRLPVEAVVKIISEDVRFRYVHSSDGRQEKFGENFGVISDWPDYVQRDLRKWSVYHA